jgi:hypothetical protein
MAQQNQNPYADCKVDPRTPHVKTPDMVKVRVKATGEVIRVNAVDKIQYEELKKPKHERDPFVMSTMPPEPYLDPRIHDPGVNQDELAQGEPDPTLQTPAAPLVGQPRAKKEEDEAARKKGKAAKEEDQDDEDQDDEDEDEDGEEEEDEDESQKGRKGRVRVKK